MAQPWTVLDRVDTDEGPLELRRRGDGDVLLTVGGRILMSSRWHHSEVALAERGCEGLSDRRSPSVLIGGLGLGYTLRAALDLLPSRARVVVAELNPAVARWCREHLGELNRHAVTDRRVELRIEDVARTVGRAADGDDAGRFDAILFDLYRGPPPGRLSRDDPFYGDAMVRRVYGALRPGGRFAVWSEQPSLQFEKRLRAAGYTAVLSQPKRGGRHAVYVATMHPRAGSPPVKRAPRRARGSR
jgi:spermidine synthase